MERSGRRTLTGVVTSDKMEKTIVVAINEKKNHPTGNAADSSVSLSPTLM